MIIILALILFSGSVQAIEKEEKMGLEVKWVFNTSAQFADKSFGAGHQGPPTVWDIDGDGVNEVIWGTRRGDSKRLWCIEADGTFQWVYPPLNEEGLPGDPVTKVSLVDVDNNGIYELCIAGRGGRLHIIDGDGSVLWTWDNPNPGQAMHGAPQAYDVDGDGFVEFFMNDNPGFIHRVDFNPDTGLNLTWTSAQAGKGNQGHPTICDIDGDGEYEVIFGSQDHNVYCLSADTGREEWKYNTGSNIKAGNPIVADLDGDGEYEALVWSDEPGSAVYCISFYGEELWRWTHPQEGANIRTCQAMGDVDNDGSMDLAIMSLYTVFMVDIGGANPTTKWEVNFTKWSEEGKLPEGATASHWSSYQLIADMDGDDQQEILWLAPYPVVTDAATGELEAYYVNEHIARNRRQENGAWWGDVDNDGISEWICELNGLSHPQTMLYCLTMNGKFPAEASWPEYYHCAYPAEYQQQQEWLTLKSAYSNSLFFPMPETGILLAGLLIVGMVIRRD